MHDILEEVFKNGFRFRVALLILVAWCLWQRRNRLTERQPSWQLHKIGEKASALVYEFWEVHKQEVRNPIWWPPIHWSPPPDAYYKGNFNAALFDGSDYAGIGVVFRDSSGNVITTLSQWIGYTPSVELVEAMVTRRTVVLAKEFSLFDVIIEGDCLRVAWALENFGSCKNLFGQVVEETKLLGCTLWHCHFQHVRWEGNRLAHGLTKRTVLSADTDIWVKELPGDLEDVFQSDFV